MTELSLWILVAMAVAVIASSVPEYTMTQTGCRIQGLDMKFDSNVALEQPGGCAVFRCTKNGVVTLKTATGQCAMSDGECHPVGVGVELPDLSICTCATVDTMDCVLAPEK